MRPATAGLCGPSTRACSRFFSLSGLQSASWTRHIFLLAPRLNGVLTRIVIFRQAVCNADYHADRRFEFWCLSRYVFRMFFGLKSCIFEAEILESLGRTSSGASKDRLAFKRTVTHAQQKHLTSCSHHCSATLQAISSPMPSIQQALDAMHLQGPSQRNPGQGRFSDLRTNQPRTTQTGLSSTLLIASSKIRNLTIEGAISGASEPDVQLGGDDGFVTLVSTNCSRS
ncbi:hypothetical protein LshimejAT787_1402470 [Lyophyllum shimeji]|uniref:Uncharacterized protein n=1 Tax=Lyophyllum shimeji TaxID=47721 RepID=A0A9P3UTL4_LYOSH|nr:hypothetical protein LshimejAT787_1402470 [Lyophyllum shimeji]